MIRGHRSWFALASLLAIACGDSEADSVYSSRLPKDTAASDLNDEQKRQFCETLETHVSVSVGTQELARIGCLPLALLTSTSREACERLLDSCSRDAIMVNVGGVDRKEKCYDDLASCEADVSTLEACVNVNLRAVRAVLERFTCARFGDSDVEGEVDQVMGTAGSCAKTSATCGDATEVLLY